MIRTLILFSSLSLLAAFAACGETSEGCDPVVLDCNLEAVDTNGDGCTDTCSCTAEVDCADNETCANDGTEPRLCVLAET